MKMVEGLHELQRLLQTGRTEQAQALLLELTARGEEGGDASSNRAARLGQWLSLFLDAEHSRLISRIDVADDEDIDALERHVASRRELLELALQAGDLAREMARTYELLGDPGCDAGSAVRSVSGSRGSHALEEKGFRETV